jgi:hypothetical protein
MSLDIDEQLWRTIHIIGKTVNIKNEDSRLAFVCLFECLSDILPDENYRSTLKSFMYSDEGKKHPRNYISSSEKAFQWTWELHSYVNFVKKKRGQKAYGITLDQANYLYDKSKISKSMWGNAFWTTMHYISANLPISSNRTPESNNRYRTSFVAFIMCIRFLLPCPDCEGHMTRYIENVDIHPFLRSNIDAFQWTWEFHNSVSNRLGKSSLEFDSAFRMYKMGNYSFIDE